MNSVSAAGIPDPIALKHSAPISKLWQARLTQQYQDTYAGVPLSKLPEDLRVYEHIMWLSAPEVVIEVGAQFGASALWFRDRLRALERYRRIGVGRVISVDIDVAEARMQLSSADPNWRETITLIESDIADPALPARIAELIPAGTPVLLSEDSAHEEATTLAALKGLARFVQIDGFIVVEDGYIDVDGLRPDDPSLPRGVLPAIEAWRVSEDGRRFRERPDLEVYGLTSNVHGFLQRIEPYPDQIPADRGVTPRISSEHMEPSRLDGSAREEIVRLSELLREHRAGHMEWRRRALLAEEHREAWNARAHTAEQQRELWEERAAHACERANEEVSRAEQSKAIAEADNISLIRQLDGLRESASWRLTAPLRLVKGWVTRAFRR
jgi:cephalosporin hydroxylase